MLDYILNKYPLSGKLNFQDEQLNLSAKCWKIVNCFIQDRLNHGELDIRYILIYIVWQSKYERGRSIQTNKAIRFMYTKENMKISS